MHPRPNSGETEDVATNLGRRLREWRDRQGLPLRVVADRLGVTCATVSCWECGKRFPSGKHIDDIAKLTGLLACQFFCRRSAGCVGQSAGACRATTAKPDLRATHPI